MNAARNVVKMMEPEKVSIGENTFYIYPMPAFKAANMSGELMALMLPMASAIAPAFGKKENVLDTDASEAATYLAGAFSSLSGDKVEEILRKLLLSGHVGVQTEGEPDAHWLSEDLSNEIFCANAQDMFILAYLVIRVNYKGFFERLGNLSGNQMLQRVMKQKFPGMASLM